MSRRNPQGEKAATRKQASASSYATSGERANGRKRRQLGGTLLEFAIIMPVFLLLTFGILDLGRGIWAYNTVSHAAREAARYAVVHGSQSSNPASSGDIQQVVTSKGVGLDPAKLVVTTSWSPDNKPGSAVQVQVRYEFSPVTALFADFGRKTLTSTSKMVIAY